MLAIDALMLTTSRMASEETNANATAAAEATQTAPRMREVMDAPPRLICGGVMYSPGCGSPSPSERKRGTK